MEWIIKFLKHAFLVVSLATAQLAAVSLFGASAAYFNIVVVAIVFASIAYRASLAIGYAFALGLILDLFSPLPFGSILFALLAAIFIVNGLSTRLLTNRSFYALMILTAVALMVFKIMIFAFDSVNYFQITKDPALIAEKFIFDLSGLLKYLALNLFAACTLFIIFHAASRRFKAVFIDTVRG